MQKNNLVGIVCSVLASVVVVGCQSTTVIQTAPVEPQATIEPEQPSSGVRVTPYPDSGIIRESKPLPPIPSKTVTPPRVILPTTQSNSTTTTKSLKDGRGVAAYEKLMQNHLQALGQNNLVEAEKNLLQAQRIAPQSADVYRELARLANLRKQGSSAEAFARKGLTFA